MNQIVTATPQCTQKEERMTSSNKKNVTRRKRYACFGKEETNEERCHRLNRFYQARFPTVPALSSRDLVRSFDSDNTVLVDVRTQPERNISTIEGAISLHEFEQRISSLPPETQVVTYCTIGYRSGLEARRLQYQYALQGRISSLDGIVAYTHAITSEDDNGDDIPRVVCPATGSDASAVHTFGSQWDCVAENYESKHFSLPTLLLRLIQVSSTVILRTGQYVTHRLGQCICRSKTTKAE